jgi:hypothetical protein
MRNTEVTVQDAIFAVLLMEYSIHSTSILESKSILHLNFPEDPREEYEALGKTRFTYARNGNTCQAWIRGIQIN